MKYLKYLLFAIVIIASSYSNPFKQTVSNVSTNTAVSQVTEDAKSIIDKVDKNMTSDTRISTTDMIIYGKRKTRTIRSKGYARGDNESFSEYLSPAKEKGTKMLKLEDKLWIYSPNTDRIIQLSGHMLKQSVMGSDLSYEDMMEDNELLDLYDAEVIGDDEIDGRVTWILELIAKVDDINYYKRKMWIDQERYVPLKEELYAKSGQLLKQTIMSDVVKIQGRWFPQKINFKDMLKSGKGTDFVIVDVEFDPVIPAYIFSKAALKK
jgi:outer membrane lipoprotein-sorting protein